MKILLITTGLGMGGAEKQVLDLADEFVTLGHQVMVMSLTGDKVITTQSKEVQFTELFMSKTPIGLVKALCNARKCIQSFKPDVIHSHMVHANIFSRILRLVIKMPMLVCTAHNTNEGGKGRILAYRYTNFLADINTNVSDEAVEAFIHSGAAKDMIAVSNGCDDKRFVFSLDARDEKRQQLNITDDTFLYMAIGRLEEQKDYPNMLDAMAEVVKIATEEGKKVKLAIIGQSYLEQKLKHLSNDLGLKDYVVFLGLQHNVERWLSAADCFVLSSEYEGFGLVVAEAMLTERVVVATDCGGVSEVVGDYGYLVPPKNPLLLSKAMINILYMTDEEKGKIGIAARQHIECKYSLKAIANKWLNIYQGHYK